MTAIASSLSPMQTITCLETIQSLLENYPCSLNDYEKGCLIRFGTLVAESMAIDLNARITILQSSALTDANSVRRAQERLAAAHSALSSLMPGDWDKYFKGNSTRPRPRMWPDI